MVCWVPMFWGFYKKILAWLLFIVNDTLPRQSKQSRRIFWQHNVGKMRQVTWHSYLVLTINCRGCETSDLTLLSCLDYQLQGMCYKWPDTLTLSWLSTPGDVRQVTWHSYLILTINSRGCETSDLTLLSYLDYQLQRMWDKWPDTLTLSWLSTTGDVRQVTWHSYLILTINYRGCETSDLTLLPYLDYQLQGMWDKWPDTMGGSTKSQKAGRLNRLEAKIVKKPASYRDYMET